MANVAILPDKAGSLGSAVVNSSSSTISVVAGVVGKIIQVYRIFFVVAGTTNITFQDGAGNAMSGPMAMVANGSFVLDIDGTPWFNCASGAAFQIVNSGSQQIGGTAYYYLVSG